MNNPFRLTLSFGLLFSLFMIALLIQYTVPYAGGWSLIQNTLFAYDTSNYKELIVHLTYLPRLAIALICGFSLAIAGCVMQFILRNPIAAPTTLGVASGAQLGMVAGVLLLPADVALPSFIPAFVGAAFASLLVFWIAAKKGLAPIHLVLSGMVISLFIGAINTMLMLVYERYLSSVFIWGAGTLNQNSWESVERLLPLLCLPIMGLFLLQRPLSALILGDQASNTIGINVKRIKLITLSLVIFVTAVVVSEVGIIGFVGIVAPGITRLLGVRHLSKQILISGVIGSLMLLLADLLTQPIAAATGDLLPTGAMTALLGAPFLLWLLNRQTWPSQLRATEDTAPNFRQRQFLPLCFALLVALFVVSLAALWIGKDSQGWHLLINENMLQLRLPRILGALFAGAGLATAGTLVQRLTNNPMASPEVLGISSGAALALVICALLGLSINRYEQIAFGTLGALSVTGVIWWLGKKHRFAPAQLLLTGIALSAGLDAVMRIVMSSGHEDVSTLLTWLSGSTYLVTYQDAILLGSGVLIFSTLAILLHRWLDLIALGEVSANSVGLNSLLVRRVLILLIAALTTLCTAVIGPLTFIGLLAPHMARSLHQNSAKKQLVTACLLGALVMVIADWVGRVLWFPWQFPAGLLSSLLGGAYFLYLMRK
ncbi:Fe(3+)-hydroxamate ABC transporter permease FhuB [Marinomonas pollencensis]|uniref:Iron complex transport system permease protein n=1 Tax=Marinomonas pollencensis TaxID=491954 RepID=A0A3E0DP87_9GAMM|nr:Fe(3+)-hydroxamate ABC transporter permease FhuB [Marinomonas pollencensis]REG83665.1 iron complex transport system permease protein [Marinomonas pollencensis]